MRKILPFIEPWPLAMMAPNLLRNSLTMTPESMPAGALMAVTEEPGEPGENSSRPSAAAAARVARASNCAFSISLSMPMVLMYFSAAPSAMISDVLGVQLDSPWAAFFLSFFRSK